jgi:hypothetical protein
MPETFIGKVEFLNTSNTPVLTVDPDNSFVQIVYKAGNFTMMELTNSSSFALAGAGNDWGARLDGSLGWLILGGPPLSPGGNRRYGKIILNSDGVAAHEHIIVLDAHAAQITVGKEGHKGDLRVRDNQGRDIFRVDSNFAAIYVGAKDHEGDIIVLNEKGDEAIKIDGGKGDIIFGNADCAEEFDVAPAQEAEPGTVMVLGEDGALLQSTKPYDKKVAGVVSGAGVFKPAIVLDRRVTGHQRLPLALMGKVFCKVDATYAAVEVGDMLTTSSTLGHAMKATDPLKAFGAVIGKALSPCLEGKGLIPILVTLQ